MQGFLDGERGSTRLALVIAAAVLAILAVVSVPLVMGIGGSAQDTRAKSVLRDLAGQVEACRVNASSYADCDEPRELHTGRSVHWGRGAGKAGVLADRSQTRAFTAYAVSRNGARMYVWTSYDTHVSRLTCPHGSVPRLEREDCDGPAW